MRWIALMLCLLAAPLPAQEVFVPEGDARRAPVVLVLHGGGGSGAQIRRTSGFDAVAARVGAVAVYPDADWRVWNDGRNPLRQGDDVGRLLAMVDALAARGIGDAGRIYVIGHSNGGGMAMRLACAAPDRIAGIAVVATKVLLAAPCEHPDAPVPALFLHDTADELAPHGGRRLDDPATARLARRLGEAMSAEGTALTWAARNGCVVPAPVVNRDPVAGDGASLRLHDFSGCAAPLRWIEIIGAGHAWPGARPVRLARRDQPLVRDLEAGAAAVDFWRL